VIFGLVKTAAQVAEVAAALAEAEQSVLVTRISPETAAEVQQRMGEGVYDATAQLLFYGPETVEIIGKGTIAVISAGTADLPVAAEAAGVAECFGNTVELVQDVGVAGIHRLLASEEILRSARVLIVVAGMEGALPSVVGGMVDKPVIAVPTSTGYGVSMGGMTALFGMLSSCASNVTVVNIDNGFGAAYAATLINRL
jgi:NCAIR mutase (PurE)-related protein